MEVCMCIHRVTKCRCMTSSNAMRSSLISSHPGMRLTQKKTVWLVLHSLNVVNNGRSAGRQSCMHQANSPLLLTEFPISQSQQILLSSSQRNGVAGQSPTGPDTTPPVSHGRGVGTRHSACTLTQSSCSS